MVKVKYKYRHIKDDAEIENILEEVYLIKQRYKERGNYKACCQTYNYSNDFGYYINNFNKTTIDSAYKGIIDTLAELYNQRKNISYLESKIKKQFPELPFNEIGYQVIKRFFQPLECSPKKSSQMQKVSKQKEN